jgi:hypothetical protein
MTQEEREKLIAAAQHQLGEALRARLEQAGDRPLTLDEIEALVEEIGREVDARLEQGLLEKHVEPAGNTAPCPECGASCRFKDTHETSWLTTHGEPSLACRYYHCGPCGHGFYPAHAALGLERGRRATRLVRAWQAKYGSESAFATVPELFRELRGLDVSASTVERTTIEVGEAVQAAARDWAPGPSERPGERVRDRYYVSMDGTMTPLRDEWRRDGALGKLVCRYGETKLGIVFQTLRRDGLDEGVVRRGCVATMAEVGPFREKLCALAEQWGLGSVPELIVLGDGAEWIWNTADAHFPQAIQILDYWHMKQHLWQVAGTMHGRDQEAAKRWVKDAEWKLNLDLVESFLKDLRRWEPVSEEAKEVKRSELGYFEGNAERMRYQTYLDRGYLIGSGAMESGCRQLAAQRLDRAGMHWRPRTADAVLAIRAHQRSTGAPSLTCYA